MIYIVTGEVRTGKSTHVYEWLKNRKDVGGFVSLDDGPLRFLYNAVSREKIDFQTAKNNEGDVLNIGKFSFHKSSFNKASEWAMDHNNDPQIKYLVIDELGKLEIKDEGFNKLIKYLLGNSEKDLIIIIRDYLYEKALTYYNITEHISLNKNELIRIP